MMRVSEATTHKDMIEELADVMEVLQALMQTLAIIPDDVETVRMRKFNERGSFYDRHYIDHIISFLPMIIRK